MLQLFFQNQSNKYIWGIILIPLFFSKILFAQGLYSNFEKLLNGQKDKYDTIINALINKDFALDEISDIEQVKIDPNYLNLIIQNTPTRYAILATIDKCSLYDLMHTDLLRTVSGPLKNVLISYKDKNGNNKRRVLDKEKFLDLIGHKQCPKVKEFKRYFELQNVRTTLQSIKLIPPKTKRECNEILDKFKKDVKTPYLCDIIENLRSEDVNRKALQRLSKTDYKKRSIYQKKLAQTNTYKKILSQKATDQLTGLCLNLSTPNKYCASYFEKSFWTTEFKLNQNSPVLKSFCKGMKKAKCINTLNSKPDFCHFAGADLPALFPKPSCTNISKALLKSPLKTLNNDCPALVGNEAVATMARVINSYDDFTSQDMRCSTNSTYAFAKSSGLYDEYNSWDVNLCFLNKLNGNQKECSPVVYDEIDNTDLSLPKVVKNIAQRTRGFKSGSCNLVEKKDYRPALLKFRSGCHIILNDKNCFGTSCKIKVIIDQVEFPLLIQENNLNFSLLPYDFINENKSFLKLYTTKKKLNLKSIKNISSYLLLQKQYPKAIFLGVGCAEDLLPSFFKRYAFNICTPLPFISDGYLKSEGSYALVTRTGVDQINAPRIIPWPYVFNAVKTYQQLHPIKLWGLYAIY